MSEEKKIYRLGLLTSGGDAPGMNAAIRAVVRTAVADGVSVLGVKRGYNGLIKGDVFEMTARTVDGITSKGGTILNTARCDEFRTEEGVKRAADFCGYMGVDAIVGIGGDGTYRGLRDLSKYGISVIGIPATIDNDIACTHYAIGFDTASNTAISAIDKLSDTMQSHERCSIVEVMGRNAGQLAVYVAVGCGAGAVLIPEKEVDYKKDIVDKIRHNRIVGKNHFIIILAEGVGNAAELADKIRQDTGLETRVSILGHIQRGGSPSARDRTMASRMGYTAVKLLEQGKSNIVVCYRNSSITDIDIDEALDMRKDIEPVLYNVSHTLSL